MAIEINHLVAGHYDRVSLADALIARLAEHGIERGAVTLEHLAALDQMHIRGHEATVELLDAMEIGEGMQVLDLGAGIGGPSRVLASRYDARVTALDLTPALCEANRELNELVGLSGRIEVVEGDALALPFEDASFDRAISIHASMNIERKRKMYREIRRVLKPGGLFGFYDIVAGVAGEPDYPMPWAGDRLVSFLMSPSAMVTNAEEAGLRTRMFRDLTNESRAHMLRQQEATAARKGAGERPPLQAGDIIMGPSAPDKHRNLRRAVKEGRVGVAMAVFEKPLD